MATDGAASFQLDLERDSPTHSRSHSPVIRTRENSPSFQWRHASKTRRRHRKPFKKIHKYDEWYGFYAHSSSSEESDSDCEPGDLRPEVDEDLPYLDEDAWKPENLGRSYKFTSKSGKWYDRPTLGKT